MWHGGGGCGDDIITLCHEKVKRAIAGQFIKYLMEPTISRACIAKRHVSLEYEKRSLPTTDHDQTYQFQALKILPLFYPTKKKTLVSS